MRCFISLLVALLGGLVYPVGAQEVPDDFEVQTVLAPLPTGTVAFAFLPDGRVLTIHKDTAEVGLWVPGTSSQSTILTVPNVTGVSERGLIGLVLDPAWPTRPYVYFYLNHNSSSGRLVMYEASGDLDDVASDQLQLSNPYWILTDVPDLGAVHKGGELHFGPDGMLYLSTGDSAQYCAAQDLESLLGKILRLDVSALPGTGSGPPAKSVITPTDNPFPGPDENERLVYAFGLRNPFSFDVDPMTGKLMIADVGSYYWEEINVLDVGATERNFGWPMLEGNLAQPDNTQLGCDPVPAVDPAYAYERGEQSAAVIAGVVYRDPGGGFGAAYEGDFFFYDFLRGNLRRLENIGDSWQLAAPEAGQPNAQDWALSLGASVCFRMGSDGAVYYLNFRNQLPAPGTGLYRIVRTNPVATPAATNPLQVLVSPNPTSAARGIRFEASALALGPVELKIFDVAGRLVREEHWSLNRDQLDWRWDGRGSDQRALPSGTYFYTLTDGAGQRSSGKLALVN